MNSGIIVVIYFTENDVADLFNSVLAHTEEKDVCEENDAAVLLQQVANFVTFGN